MPSCFVLQDFWSPCWRPTSPPYWAGLLRARELEIPLKAARKGARGARRGGVPGAALGGRRSGHLKCLAGTARDRGVEGPTRGAGGVRGRACRPPGGPPDACAGVGATATIRARDSAQGGSEVIIMYMYARPCMRWGIHNYLWVSGACGTALFAPKYALLRRTAGKSGSVREKLTFYRPKVGGICTLNKD